MNKKVIDEENRKIDVEEKSIISSKKSRKRIHRKILLVLLVVLALIFVLFSVNKIITKNNDGKITNAIDNLKKEKSNFVFIEINPSLVIDVRNNKVNDVACLNDDCMSFYDDIEVIGKSMNDSIVYLYNLVESKGFDTSNGMKIKTTSKLEIDTDRFDYVTVEHISETEKNELLASVKNNQAIKNNNDDYYTNLWNELKKDKDYGSIYECFMDSNELKCFIKWDNTSSDVNFFKKMQKFNDMERVLNKFGIKTKKDSDMGFEFGVGYIYINDIEFSWGGFGCASQHMIDGIGTDEGYYNDYSYTKDGYVYCLTLLNESNGLNLLDPESVLDRLLVEEDEITAYKYRITGMGRGQENSVATLEYCSGIYGCDDSLKKYYTCNMVLKENEDASFIQNNCSEVEKETYDNFRIK